jgi:hypothetical protein
MYFNIAVAIERKGKKVDDLAREAGKILSRFDYSTEVPQYKRYLKQDEIEDIADEYQLSPTDMEAIAKHTEEFRGHGEGLIDAKGIYQLSTENAEGRFDDYEVFYYATPDDFEGKVLGGDSDWPRVHAFVTPELEWIEGYWQDIERATLSGQEKEYYAWKDRLTHLLEKYQDCAIFIARCHF